MEGKRFGAGVLGGLLLALLIVGSTAFNGGLFGSFTAAVPVATQSAVTSSSTLISTSMTTEATMTGTTLSSVSSIPLTVSTGGANQVTSSASSSVSSVSASSSSSSTVDIISSVTGATSSQTPAEPWYNFLVSAAGFQPSSGSSQPSPSRLSAIAAQPAVLNGFVLVPLLVAVILGALLYRASGRRRSAESESKLE